MLIALLVLAVPVTAWGIWKTRRDYRIHGKLTWAGLGSVCLMLLVPNLMLEYATRYELPSTLLAGVGVVVGVHGCRVRH